MNFFSIRRFTISVWLVLLCELIYAQNTVTLQKANGKQKEIDLTKVFALQLERRSSIEGKIVGHDSTAFHVMVSSSQSGEDSLIYIQSKAIKRLWLCPRKTEERCEKWSDNQEKNEARLNSVLVPLFAANIITGLVLQEVTASWIITATAVAIYSTVAIINNPNVIRLNKNYSIVTQ